MYHLLRAPSERRPAWRGGVGLIVAGLLAAGGCGEAGAPDLDAYFAATGEAIPAPCPPDGRLAGRRQVRLFVAGQGEQLAAATRGLARYFRRHGLEFFTLAPAERIALDFVIDNRPRALRGALEAEFPGVNIDDPALPADNALWPRVRKFAMNFQMRPARDFLATHGEPDDDQITSIVLVPNLEGAPPTATLPAIGMSLSRPLLAALDRQEPALERPPLLDVDFPQTFAPVVFLSATALARLAMEDPAGHDRAVAHELGHSGGLLHEADAQDLDNLMYPRIRRGVDECAEQLTDDQLVVLHGTLLLDPAPGVAREVTDRPRWPGTSASDRLISPGTPAPLDRLLAPLSHAH